MNLKEAVAVCVTTSVLFGMACFGLAQSADPAGKWTAEKAGEWYAKQSRLFGFNFVPSTAVNDTEMWQDATFDPKTIDRELAWAEGLGYNSCRVFLQYIVWKQDPEGFKKRFEQKLLVPANAPQVGLEGAFLFKANGRYHVSCADVTDGRYHCYVASSKSLMGPYGDRYLAIPHAGHNMFFKDKQGNWWSTFFGWQGDPPFTEGPGILRVEFGLDGEPRPAPIRD
jgi:hypothetical protein